MKAIIDLNNPPKKVYGKQHYYLLKVKKVEKRPTKRYGKELLK